MKVEHLVGGGWVGGGPPPPPPPPPPPRASPNEEENLVVGGPPPPPPSPRLGQWRGESGGWWGGWVVMLVESARSISGRVNTASNETASVIVCRTMHRPRLTHNAPPLLYVVFLSFLASERHYFLGKKTPRKKKHVRHLLQSFVPRFHWS